MEIVIGEDWRIASDEHCWTVDKRSVVQSGSNSGKVLWRSISYWPTLTAAVHGLYEQKLRESEATSIEQALADSARIIDEITAAFRPSINVSESPR